MGMGPESLPNMLEKLVEGLALLGLSAALSEVYVEEVAAEGLYELILHLKPPHELTPFFTSWSRIVKGCAGALAKTKFGIMAEIFMSFHPSETSIFPTRKADEQDENHEKWRSRSHAKDIAKALFTLGEISRGKLQSVTISGGGDSGFLAAVSEWLFDMKIVIVGSEGEAIYNNFAPGSTVQARFEFRDQMDESPSQDTEVEAFQYPRRTIHLRDVSDILYANDSNEEMRVSGRLQWSRCLSSAYGYAFKILMDRKENFSRVLGCAARIFRAIATAEQGIDLRSRQYWTYYMNAGSGSRFVQNLMFWFPELRSIELLTQRAAACKLADARANYESGLCNLATSCRCRYCDRTQAEQPQTGYCLVALTETILKAALILSNVSIDPGPNPTRHGFDRLCEGHIAAKPDDEDKCEQRETDLGPIIWVIETGSEDQDRHGIDHRMRLIMNGALGLFTFLQEVKDSITCALLNWAKTWELGDGGARSASTELTSASFLIEEAKMMSIELSLISDTLKSSEKLLKKCQQMLAQYQPQDPSSSHSFKKVLKPVSSAKSRIQWSMKDVTRFRSLVADFEKQNERLNRLQPRTRSTSQEIQRITAVLGTIASIEQLGIQPDS